MATGDLKGNLRKIEQELRLLNYPRDVDYNGLAKGDPSVFLPIISYCFTSFSTYITELLVESGVELTAKSDLRFIDAVYKLLRDQFQYKPVLSKQQFLQYGFAERKIQIVCDIISSVCRRHKELSNINKKPQIERHKSILDARIPHDVISEALDVKEDADVCVADVLDSGADVLGSVHEQVLEDSNELEELKHQLAELQEKFKKVNWVEDKLLALEERLQGKIVIDEKDWNNLLGRVLLLETQLVLQSQKDDLSTEFNNMSEEITSSRNITPVSPEKEKVELPESLQQSSGYSSLLSGDPSPKAMVVNNPALSEVSKETTIQRMERISKMIEETSELLKTSSNTS
ncbi:centrosomal protein of 44 kDa isoform X2 [Elgaria multicarinata webbii]|uniref:centrosomal protein of 44 kDa isoform X2 n=1 Tax=Elgaria multicarinata webbii TaxID=159646 RepID=UPI002FCD3089